ncbi:MAG: 30S ribosomal protein S18 [Patescibacteria group bacterium]
MMHPARPTNTVPAVEKQCYFCTSNIKIVDYKNADLLKRFIDPQARIMPKRRSGVCALHQRKLARAVKRARIMALLPFVGY